MNENLCCQTSSLKENIHSCSVGQSNILWLSDIPIRYLIEALFNPFMAHISLISLQDCLCKTVTLHAQNTKAKPKSHLVFFTL